MRVIGGTAKGRKLLSVPGDTTRPILDRVKVPLFDILRPRIQNISILDLFAGSGSVGIEALSQGGASAMFIDTSAKAIETIKKNLESTGLKDKAEVRHADAFSFLKKTTRSFDLIYVAPPQYESLWVQAMHAIGERPAILADRGEIVVQIDPKEYEVLSLSDIKETSQRKYGNTLLVFYSKM